MISYLRCKNVGPAKEIEINPGNRLNLFVGDNGLGKSFALEIIWWVLSGKWAQYPAQPRTDTTESEISFRFSDGRKEVPFLILPQSSSDTGINIEDILSPNPDSFAEWEEEPEDFIAKAEPFYELGELAFEQGKYSEARSYFRKSLSKFRNVKEERGIARTIWQLSKIEAALANYLEAENFANEALEISQKIQDDNGIAKALNSLGAISALKGKYSEASKFHLETLEIDLRTIGKEHPDYADHLSRLAWVYEAQGRHNEAITLYEQAIKIAEKTVGKNHRDYSKYLSNLAWVYRSQGNYRKAEEFAKQSVQISAKTNGKEHPYHAIRLTTLAAVYQGQGKNEEAIELYKQIIEMDEKTIGKEHHSAISLNNLALIYRSQGRYEEAIELLRRAIEIGERTGGREYFEHAARLNNLANVYRDQGRYEEAIELYTQAIEIDEKTVGKNHPEYVKHLNNLAHAYQMQGKSKEADQLRTQVKKLSSGPENKQVIEQNEFLSPEVKFNFDASTQDWKGSGKIKQDGLAVYSRVDGSYAVWDSMRDNIEATQNTNEQRVFRRSDVWDGANGIEGLLRDWVKWQNAPKEHPFEVFRDVLKKLSPPDMGTLTPGKPTRLSGDAREIPTIEHPYGIVPVLYSSAAIRRILSLAYMIVWTWNEHKVYADIYNRPLQKKMYVLVDEIEAHLHPQWQRTALAALLEVGKELDKELDVQFFVASHSPLVMASLESIFDKKKDSLFHLRMATKGDGVVVEEIDFYSHGTIDAWLTSDLFGLKQSSSKERELAIEKARKIQKKSRPTKKEIAAASEELKKHLSEHDEFWPLWLFFAEEHGVKI